MKNKQNKTNKLIIVSNRNIVTKNNPTASLLGRGLSNLKSKANLIGVTDLEVTYRKARDAYNGITKYGEDGQCQVKSVLDITAKLNNSEPFFIKTQQLVDVSFVFQELADNHFGKAYFPLAIMYLRGQGISQNLEKSDFYFKRAFEWCFTYKELIDPEIWSDLGEMYSSNNYFLLEQDDEKSVLWHRKAAEYGYKWSQYKLGIMYSEYHGCWIPNNLNDLFGNTYVLEEDDETAMFWYRKAADQGHVWSQSALADMYRDGRGVEQDKKQAINWYRKAAIQGNIASQNYLIMQKINWK